VSERGTGKGKVLAAVVVVAAIIAAVVRFGLGGGGILASPVDMSGQPIRVASTFGDRVLLLTSQWKTFRGYRSRSSYTDLLIDVWAFDARDGKPLWRTRLTSDRHGVNMGRAILGAQGGIVWVLQGSGLTGLSLKDGKVAVDNTAIETANPGLKGLLPTEQRFYQFRGDGLSFTAADGRVWRLTGQGAKAEPAGAAPDRLAAGVTPPAHIGGGNSSWSFLERALDLPNQWLGLLDDTEAKTFATQGAIGGIDPASHPRTRLWRAKKSSKSTFFGPKAVYSDLKPLPEGPEFLTAGLLTSGVTHAPPILAFRPDSVLVIHTDRLGAEGRWRLSRASGPLGKVLWTAPLPMQTIESVMPGEGSVVLIGRKDEPARRAGDRPDSVLQLAAVDLATGKVGIYGFKVKATANGVLTRAPLACRA
jgi:hypothetical protein